MTEAEWLSSTDPTAMLATLRAITIPGQVGFIVPGEVGNLAYYASDRKLRLFAVACCRQVWDGVPCPRCKGEGELPSRHGIMQWHSCETCHGTGRVGGLTDPRSRRAVEVAERYADGEATEQERIAADREAADAVVPYNDMTNPQWIAQASCGLTVATEAAWEVVRRPLDWITPAAQAALLREVCGNPFRPAAGWIKGMRLPEGATVNTDFAKLTYQRPEPWLESILAWNDGTVPQIAQAIYDERRWQDMPILADALLDAGCDDEDILRHCRGRQRCPWADPDPAIDHGGKTPAEMACPCNGTGWRPLATTHVRGCWVIDLVLGKE